MYLKRAEGEGQKATTAGQTVELVTKDGLGGANRKLDQVRLALARNLARALVVGFENPF